MLVLVLVLMQAERELHITSDVAFAFQQHWRATHDESWLKATAWPVLQAVAEYWSSRIVLGGGGGGGKGHIYDVMGPDEWHDHTNDSAFTNAGAGAALRFAAEAAVLTRDAARPPTIPRLGLCGAHS